MTNILRAVRIKGGFWAYNLDAFHGVDSHQAVNILVEEHGFTFREAREKLRHARNGAVVCLRPMADA